MASSNAALHDVRRIFDITLAVRRSRQELVERAQCLSGMDEAEREALLVALQANGDQLQAVTKEMRERIQQMQASGSGKIVPC